MYVCVEDKHFIEINIQLSAIITWSTVQADRVFGYTAPSFGPRPTKSGAVSPKLCQLNI